MVASGPTAVETSFASICPKSRQTTNPRIPKPRGVEESRRFWKKDRRRLKNNNRWEASLKVCKAWDPVEQEQIGTNQYPKSFLRYSSGINIKHNVSIELFEQAVVDLPRGASVAAPTMF
jgi:hypothetical protein